MVILASQSGDFARDKGRQVAETLLQAHPDATIVYAHNDEMALGAIAAIEAAGKVPGKDILVVSIDGEKDALPGDRRRQARLLLRVQPALRAGGVRHHVQVRRRREDPAADHQPGPLLRRQQRQGGAAERLLRSSSKDVSLVQTPPACFAAGGRARFGQRAFKPKAENADRPHRSSSCATSTSASRGCKRCRPPRSRSRRARSWRWSARTGPASRR